MTAWEVALDGWVGSMIGAFASIGVAVFVLRRTLAHERKVFDDQLQRERVLVAEQFERERALVAEQKQVEAFGDVASAANAYLPLPIAFEELRRLGRELDSAVQRWLMYLQPDEQSFGRLVLHCSRTLRELADEGAASARLEDEEHMRSASEATIAISTIETDTLANNLIVAGRLWHSDRASRAETVRDLELALQYGEAAQGWPA